MTLISVFPGTRSTFLPVLALLLGLAGSATAQDRQGTGASMQLFNGYEVHYVVFNSTFIQPEMAERYGIVRARNRAVLNIAVRERVGDEDETEPRRAIVRGTHSDLVHRTPLEFREFVESDAIYYIAELRFAGSNEERHFDLKIQPDPDGPVYSLEFSHTLYRD